MAITAMWNVSVLQNSLIVLLVEEVAVTHVNRAVLMTVIQHVEA